MKMMRDILSGIVFLIAMVIVITGIFVMAVFLTGKGKVEPYYDAEGKILENSVAERAYVTINGRKNGMIIRGKNVDNPVLLFISGGPGVPQYWMNEYYENQIEEQYTVCWWDWSGEGLSYDSNMNPEDITMESLTNDARSVAGYLRKRFGKEKIYLMAHSGGTPLGLALAKTDAEDFYCYFAMGQYQNEKGSRYTAGYTYLKSFFEATEDKKALNKLNSFMKMDEDNVYRPVDEKTIAGSWEGLLLRAGCGTTREMRSDAREIFFPQMFSKCYTFTEKLNYWRGKMLNEKSTYRQESDQVTSTGKIGKVLIPVYFISGRYDYTCPVTLVEKLYENLDAPDKGMYIFEDSAHSPLWEENEKVLAVMKSKTRW